MKKLNLFLYSILAGFDIALAAVAFLSIDDKIVGAVFFTIGMFTVLVFGHNLFTGKVCYLFDNPPSYILDLIIIWVGNLVGSIIVGSAIKMTRMATIVAKAKTISNTKLNDSLLSIFILATFCGILIYISVDSYKNNPHEFGKYLGFLLCIPAFILCSYEHCVANMLYFTVAGVWGGKTFVYLIVMTLGNSLGGVIMPLCKKIKVMAEATPNMAGRK